MEMPEIDPSAIEPPVEAKPSSIGWLWPAITNEQEAQKAAKGGAYAAVIVAVLTSAINLIAIGAKKPVMGMDGWGLVDALLFAVIAWRVFKFSLPWAVMGLLLYVAETFWRWSTVGVPTGTGIVTTSFLILAFIAGVRGTAFLSHKGNLNGLFAVVIVIAFAAAFTMYIYRSTHTDLDTREKNVLDELNATDLVNDFVSLNTDYYAKDWNGFRTELLSREHYLTDLKKQDQFMQIRLREEPVESDTCGRIGEHALHGFITAQDNLMSFAKDNIILTHNTALSAKSLMAQNDSASREWNRYIDNIKDCGGSK